ncbi:hypothetical protein GGTG_12787 [Gaeumannomyces tritici R3-111a-1]|uniref:NADH:flavin oxidoreductase/NADH oxidase N-terminal domain-containing protein n=1 Tax=Gaeumannomyces tritici (strain R3-111a-1) TaxID=644352 RepID=J3PH07_GAET3|nr:hypothetical protein GGTG_12787 [Gaeumannomyces tritici R3-111a-1]EJT69904.1 hypothetical protein GGTG_12787 [Gaeumannomyces tritici R3-111a-1]
MSRLFTPLKLGKSQLANRLALAPMTRFRVDDNYLPIPAVKDYYEQRAAVPGTLLITEGILVSTRHVGHKNLPGIWSEEQVTAWREVTDAVHAKGGVIYAQLWAHGRTGEPGVFEEMGSKLMGPSAIPMSEDSPTPAEMTEDDIRQLIADYAQAARNAIRAGFDGVEIHNANGYLLDEFLQDVSNQRVDGWGGSVEKRVRLPLEVAKAVAEAIGADRTGIRISPYGKFQGMLMADPDPTFRHFIEQLAPLGLAYLHVIETRQALVELGIEDTPDRSIDWIAKLWASSVGGPVIVGGGHTPESARQTVEERFKGLDVLVGFGRWFISNPDLVFRIQHGVELTKYDRNTFYIPKSLDGYADYGFSSEYQVSQGKN